MKRIFAFVLILMMMLTFISFAFVSAEVTPENSKLIKDNPKTFYARGFHYVVLSDEIPPFHRLQNIMEFEFTDGIEIQKNYSIEYSDESIYGPAVHTLELNLTYNRALLQTGENFISGTFSYYWDRNGDINEYTGIIVGGMIEVSTDIMDFSAVYDYTNTIALDLSVDGDPWDWTIYLEVPGEEIYYIGSTYIEENYTNSENTPHVPSPDSQADVAAGVGISTIGIALANALTKTSVLGGTSINLNVTVPASPAPVTPAAPVAQQIPSSETRNFFSAIGNFFKNLFANLRDMLTDEGRSYASGRVADFLDDTDFEDSSDDN